MWGFKIQKVLTTVVEQSSLHGKLPASKHLDSGKHPPCPRPLTQSRAG